MVPLDRVMAAIQGSCQNPPVVIPYLQYYFPTVVEQISKFTRDDLLEGEPNVKLDALSYLHEYFDCDWIRVTTDPYWLEERYGEKMSSPSGVPITAEQLLEDGVFDVARGLVQWFGRKKFLYGRIGIPYGALFGNFGDIAGALIALKLEPERCIKVMEDAIGQRLEELKVWAEIGVHGVWLGQWLCSADLISEADYLKFVFPYDEIIIKAVHDAGMISLYHFCGDVVPRLKHIVKSKPMVVGVEESKKGFQVDIGQVRSELGDGVCLLGNVDVYSIVEQGVPEAWDAEIERQIRAAGPERFIVSCGSPITHDTPPETLREFVRTGKRVRDRVF